jgi:hypothetical protein
MVPFSLLFLPLECTIYFLLLSSQRLLIWARLASQHHVLCLPPRAAIAAVVQVSVNLSIGRLETDSLWTLFRVSGWTVSAVS